jgi:hypothetical protein
MFIDVRSQKAFSAPAGRHVYAQMSLLTELASFFLLGLYAFRAAGAIKMLYPQNPMRSADFRLKAGIVCDLHYPYSYLAFLLGDHFIRPAKL